MSDVAPAKLYSPDLLALTVRLAEFPLSDDLRFRGSARSRTCGGKLDIGLITGLDGEISRAGMLVSACAVGQAAAALFAGGAAGRNGQSLAAALAEMESWLEGSGPAPDWPGIDALAPARDHPGRHGAILMPWRAALDALPKDELGR